MKKIFYLLTIFLILGCSDTRDSATNEAASTDGKGGSMATFILKDKYLYTVDNSRLNVFNIDNAENPVKVNTVNIGFNIETLFSFDKYLFVGSRNAMYIYSIENNPEVPVMLSQARHFTACDPVVANATSAFVTIHNNTACNPNANNNRLLAYNITDIKNPLLISERALQQPKGLALYKNYVIVCDKTDLLFFDVTDLKNITLAHSIPNTEAIDLIVNNNRIMAFTKTDVVQFEIDPSDIKKTKKVSSYQL